MTDETQSVRIQPGSGRRRAFSDLTPKLKTRRGKEIGVSAYLHNNITLISSFQEELNVPGGRCAFCYNLTSPKEKKKNTLATELNNTDKLLFHLSKGIILLEHVLWRIKHRHNSELGICVRIFSVLREEPRRMELQALKWDFLKHILSLTHTHWNHESGSSLRWM